MSSMKKSKDTLKQMKMKNTNPKSVGLRQSNPKREIQSITGLSQKRRKNSQKPSNFTLKGTLNRTTNKAQSQKKEGNNKNQGRDKLYRV